MRTLLFAVALWIAPVGAAQTASTASPEAPPPPAQPSAAPPAAKPSDPNVVVLRGAAAPDTTRWWEDAAYDRRISLSVKGVDLDGAVAALAKAANLNMVAAGGSKARKKASLTLKDAPLRDVMLAVANLYGLLWFKTGDVYTLTYVSASSTRAKTTVKSTERRPNLPAMAAPRATLVVPDASGRLRRVKTYRAPSKSAQ
ncbi:MAG TPA: hypothetical protein VGM37_17190 [Armatimonadota bacterium]|jgi:hypothetical protein